MRLEVVEGYPEYRAKLVRAFAKCLGIKLDYVLFLTKTDKKEDNAQSND